MSKITIKDTEWVKEQIPVKLDDNGNIVNKETGEPVGEKIFDMIGEGEPTIDMNPGKEGVLYFDKTSGIIWVCTSNEEDNNIWKSITGKVVNPTISKLDIFNDGSCIALYQFDGNANDTGGEYNGQWKDEDDNDIDGFYEDGKFGKCAKFDDDNKIDCPDIGFDIDTNELTVSCWTKSTQDDNIGTCVDCFGDGGTVFGISLKSVEFFNEDSSDALFIDRDYKLSDGNWHFVAIVVKDNDTLTLYEDGKKISSTSDKTDIGRDDGAKNLVRLGYQTDGNPHELVGCIDQVRIFNRALTDDEVEALYKEGGN